jgi:hypothetical protein
MLTYLQKDEVDIGDLNQILSKYKGTDGAVS